MNIDEIRSSQDAFLRIEDVCGSIIPCSPKTLRKMLHANPKSVQIPVVRLGNRFFIPSKPFLNFLDGSGRNNDVSR